MRGHHLCINLSLDIRNHKSQFTSSQNEPGKPSVRPFESYLCKVWKLTVTEKYQVSQVSEGVQRNGLQQRPSTHFLKVDVGRRNWAASSKPQNQSCLLIEVGRTAIPWSNSSAKSPEEDPWTSLWATMIPRLLSLLCLRKLLWVVHSISRKS